ncbi:MAG: 2-methylcitrate dehydratase PrpD [Parasphingorhabdus sp.]|jgi:2-methylcitrate dehydratase PrpD
MISKTIAKFAANTSSDSIPDSARQIMRLSLLDWCAVTLAGFKEPVSAKVRNMVLADGGSPDSSLIGANEKLPARSAALSNGTTSHALDYDDTHFIYIGHPSVAVLPAAFAIAEKRNLSLSQLVDAALLGVESACRIGDWMGREHYQTGFHQTATSGCFGAAMAAARLLQLDVNQTMHALGLASTRASGLKSQFGNMGKPFNAGLAASNAVEVATLAGDGFLSRPDGLECEQGFASTHSGEARDPEQVLQNLGTEYLFESVQHKFHACCHGIHATLEALNDLVNTHQPDAQLIERVEVTIHPRWLRVCNIPRPESGLEAKFSYKLATAMALHGIDTGALDTYTDENCRRPELIQLRDRVVVHSDATVSETAAKVVVETKGVRLEQSHDLEQPRSIQDRTDRVQAKAATLIGKDRVQRLWNQINNSNDLSARQFVQIVNQQ